MRVDWNCVVSRLSHWHVSTLAIKCWHSTFVCVVLTYLMFCMCWQLTSTVLKLIVHTPKNTQVRGHLWVWFNLSCSLPWTFQSWSALVVKALLIILGKLGPYLQKLEVSQRRGIGPVRRLDEKAKSTSWVSSPSRGGIGPVTKVFWMVRSVKRVSW